MNLVIEARAVLALGIIENCLVLEGPNEIESVETN